MIYHGRIDIDTQNEFFGKIEHFPEPLRLMCLNIWATGIRIGEACTITGGDYSFDGEDAWLKFREHKYSRIRIIPIPVCLYELMGQYIVGKGIKTDEYVFKDENGQAYNTTTFRTQLRKINCERENGYIFKPHKCRYRIVTEMMQDGVSVDEISDFLGHRAGHFSLPAVNGQEGLRHL